VLEARIGTILDHEGNSRRVFRARIPGKGSCTCVYFIKYMFLWCFFLYDSFFHSRVRNKIGFFQKSTSGIKGPPGGARSVGSSAIVVDFYDIF